MPFLQYLAPPRRRAHRRLMSTSPTSAPAELNTIVVKTECIVRNPATYFEIKSGDTTFTVVISPTALLVLTPYGEGQQSELATILQGTFTSTEVSFRIGMQRWEGTPAHESIGREFALAINHSAEHLNPETHGGLITVLRRFSRQYLEEAVGATVATA